MISMIMTHLRIEILGGQVLLIQKEWKVPLFAIHPHTGKHFASPRLPNGTYPVGRVPSTLPVILQNTGISESRGGIEPRIHSTLDATMHHKQSIRGNVARATRCKQRLVLSVKRPVILVVLKQKAKSCGSSGRGHTLSSGKLRSEARPGQPNFLPVELVRAAIPLLPDVSDEHNDTQRLALSNGKLQHTRAIGCKREFTVVIPGPGHTLLGLVADNPQIRHAIQLLSGRDLRPAPCFRHTPRKLLARRLRATAAPAPMDSRLVHTREIPPPRGYTHVAL